MSYPVVGIDLGTCYTSLYVYKDGQPQAVPGDCSHCANKFASYVSYYSTPIVCGENAKKDAEIHYASTAYNVKRFLGKSLENIEKQIIVKQLKHNIRADNFGNPMYYLFDKNDNFYVLSPKEVDVVFLKWLLTKAVSFLGIPITHCVITVPAFFSQAQIKLTGDAASEAGLEVLKVLLEPVAASIASEIHPNMERKYAMIYDLGGGTFDCTLMELKNNEYRIVMTSGDPYLGGEDFDWRLEKLLDSILKDNGVTIYEESIGMMKLKRMAEDIKITLSQCESAEFDLNMIDPNYCGDPVEITRQQFVNEISDLICRSIDICKIMLDACKVVLDNKDYILLVGGSSRIPYVLQMLKVSFPSVFLRNNQNCEEIVAKGACLSAVRAYVDKTSQSIPVNIEGNVVHSMIVRTIFIKVRNIQYIILERGSSTNCWMSKDIYGTPGQPSTHVDIWQKLSDTKDEKLGRMEIKNHLFTKIRIEMMVNEAGHLICKYGPIDSSENREKAEILFQGELTEEELNLNLDLIAKSRAIDSIHKIYDKIYEGKNPRRDYCLNLLCQYYKVISDLDIRTTGRIMLDDYIVSIEEFFKPYM